FFASQTQFEKNHIIAAFRFELTRVQTQAIRERVVSMLANIDDELATGVAHGLGFEVPAPQPKALEVAPDPEVQVSPALSLFARPGDGSVKARKVAILVAPGMHGASARALHAAVTAAGAVPRFVGLRLGKVDTSDGPIHAEISLEAGPSVLYDAVVFPDGDDAVDALLADACVLDFAKEQYRHCKTILALGAGVSILEEAGISATLPTGEDDPGVLMVPAKESAHAAPRFLKALARHRHFERETDPPAV
ncbi:MAG: catalase HPII, partial [Proteobacteria bacterium]